MLATSQDEGEPEVIVGRDGNAPLEGGPSRQGAGTVGVILTRVVVPLWLLTGAVLKLVDGSPSNLPASLVKVLGGSGVDLMFVLQFSAAVELVVVGVAWLLPQIARPVVLVMLAVFFPVVVGDLLLGSASCGCFGAVKTHPAITLTLEVVFFLGVLLLGRRAPSLRVPGSLPVARTVAAGLWTLAAFAISFGLAGAPTNPAEAGRAPEGTGEEAVAPLPEGSYYVPDYASWVGKPWQEVPIASWVQGAGEAPVDGTGYVLFYRIDCEHCHELMELFFAPPLQWPTLAVAVPERAGFPTEGVLGMPCTECAVGELPSGIDWFMATPVLVRLSDGVVACAAEVDAADPECLQ